MFAAAQSDSEAEESYQKGVRLLNEARGSGGSIGGYGFSASNRGELFKNAVVYLQDASSKGHIGAKIQIESYNQKDWGGGLYEIQKTSFCCNEYTCNEGSGGDPGRTARWGLWDREVERYNAGYVCYQMLGCCCILCINLNYTTEAQINETHAAFDQKIQQLSEWKVKVRDPLLKAHAEELKQNVLRAKAKYDEKVSLRCSKTSFCYDECCVEGRGCLWLFNYKIR
jgi:hypothetical protein